MRKIDQEGFKSLSFGEFMRKKEPHDIFLEKTVGNGKSVNPFLQEMYYNISFNTWLNYAR